MLRVEAFDHIVFNVTDVEVSAAWYERVLGMTRETAQPPQGGPVRTSLKFSRNKINLRPVGASQEEWVTGSAPQAGSVDLCLLTEATPEAVATHFEKSGVTIENGPVAKNGAVGPICSVYVRDPDGNLIEISSYRD